MDFFGQRGAQILKKHVRTLWPSLWIIYISNLSSGPSKSRKETAKLIQFLQFYDKKQWFRCLFLEAPRVCSAQTLAHRRLGRLGKLLARAMLFNPKRRMKHNGRLRRQHR